MRCDDDDNDGDSDFALTTMIVDDEEISLRQEYAVTRLYVFNKKRMCCAYACIYHL